MCIGRWWACALTITHLVDFIFTCSRCTFMYSIQYTVAGFPHTPCYLSKFYEMYIGLDPASDFQSCGQAAVCFQLHSLECSHEHVHSMPHRLFSAISRLLAPLQISWSAFQLMLSLQLSELLNPSQRPLSAVLMYE